MFVLALLTACVATTRPTCEETPETVGDDDALPNGTTAAGRMAEIAGAREIASWWPDDTPVDVEVAVGRGDGAAEWVRSEEVAVTRRRLGFAHNDMLYLAFCHDHLRVPARLTVRTPDGAVDVDAPTVARLYDDEQQGESATAAIEALEIPGLPPFEDWFGDETTRDGDPLVPAEAWVRVDIDETPLVEAGWNGVAELDDGSRMAWTRWLLGQPAD